jgi:hypothetical protein
MELETVEDHENCTCDRAIGAMHLCRNTLQKLAISGRAASQAIEQ